jgi:3-hydroxyacyl-[acyl-carrier-protein] dehydratase
MDQREIAKRIPHRAPFLWIDRIVELEPGVRCVTLKSIDPAEPFFAGHFPGKAILPGVFLIEAVAQTTGVMLSGSGEKGSVPTADERAEHIPLLVTVDRFKFLKPVAPGSELRIETRKLAEIGPMVRVMGTVHVGSEVVAKGELSVVSS